MKAQLFGEFLVERGLLNEDVLIEVVSQQIAGTPSAFDVIRERRLLESKKIIQVLGRQSVEGTDFVSTCRSLGFWTDEIAAAVRADQEKSRIPIAQLLLDSEIFNLESLGKALESYLAEVPRESTPAIEPSSPPPKPAQAESVPRAEVPPLVGHYCDLFDGALNVALQSALSEPVTDKTSMEGLVERVRQARGAALIADLPKSAFLIEVIEDVLSLGRRVDLQDLKSGLDLLWRLRERLAAGEKGEHDGDSSELMIRLATPSTDQGEQS